MMKEKYKTIYSEFFHAWTVWEFIDECTMKMCDKFNTYEEAEHWIEEKENEK